MSWFKKPTAAPESNVEIPHVPDGVLQLCHPEWRGVRSSAHAYGDPVLESSDLSELSASLPAMVSAGVHVVVIQGWPPNAEAFAKAASAAGISVLSVFHSSPAQHGVDGGEAEAVEQMLSLRELGVIDKVATVKAGLVASMDAVGHPVEHVPNRVPDVTRGNTRRGSDETNAGIFLHPMWRKNVTTQILAARQLGWKPFVMADPRVPYLRPDAYTVVGELGRDEFLSLVETMDITLNVTLSECHPMMPMESYRLGVPCLLSRTSDLFTADPALYALTTVDQPDNPDAIASQAAHLLARRDEAVERANRALDAIDAESADRWRTFTRG